jgi:glycosyltransferase involved in cell wall biosynthesis
MITVGIKALNEEQAIGEALRHALIAVAPFGGKVILADSGSTDRTVEIARNFPVKIVQLKNTAERCCGAAAQLAFQSTDTEFFYLQDGDITLN